jgi:hypothetical protein
LGWYFPCFYRGGVGGHFSDFGEKNQSRNQNVAFYTPIWVGSFGRWSSSNSLLELNYPPAGGTLHASISQYRYGRSDLTCFFVSNADDTDDQNCTNSASMIEEAEHETDEQDASPPFPSRNEQREEEEVKNDAKKRIPAVDKLDWDPSTTQFVVSQGTMTCNAKK